MKKIAIITFFHSEASTCLAKYIAKQGVETDLYVIADVLRDRGAMSGFEYRKASKRLGIYRLSEKETPELYSYAEGLPLSYNLIRILSFSNKLWLINRIIFRDSLRKISRKEYDGIIVVGQHPWVEYIHKCLRSNNTVHLIHEIGVHSTKTVSTPLLDAIIRDRSPMIFLSSSTADRFKSIPGSENCRLLISNMGKFETSLLYEKQLKLDIPIKDTLPTFLFYGFIRPYKGLSLLCEVHKYLCDRYDDFTIIIAGAGDDPSLEYFRKQNNCYVINRFISNDEMMTLNRLCRAVIMPYKSASQSGIIPTTFMMGKPVIATKVGALAEVVKDGYNGLLVEPNDAAGFANAMERLIDDKELYAHLVEGAKRFGNGDEYDWNHIAKQTLEFILS